MTRSASRTICARLELFDPEAASSESLLNFGFSPEDQAGELLNTKDGYEVTKDDERMLAAGGNGQLFGQFLLDRNGIVRWSFTEVPEGGRLMFGAPSGDEVQQLVS